MDACERPVLRNGTHKGANKGASTNSVARNCHNNRNCVDCDVQYRDLGISTSFPLFILFPGEFTRLLLISTVIKDHSFCHERIDFKSSRHMNINKANLELHKTDKILHSCFLSYTKMKFIMIWYFPCIVVFLNLTRASLNWRNNQLFIEWPSDTQRSTSAA